ncbi:MAG TPA: zf-HC2 domain-containing protein [Gemmatimonadales bacterium]|nr:zf-HC2 domain-containing protein [Gemmatimonadales bacterium]
MNCTDVREQLDTLATTPLSGARREALEAHVASCAECRLDLEAARVLAGRIGALARSIEPPVDLWPRIAARVQSRRNNHVGLAAAAVLLVAASSVGTMLVVQRGSDVAATDSLVNGTMATGGVTALEADYIHQATLLGEILEAERERLAPATIETLERNLLIIDRAIAESRQALEADPGNPDLRVLLRAGHEQKVALLEQVARLASEI